MHQLLLKGIKGSSSQRRTKEQSAWSLRVLLEPGGGAKLQLRGAVGDVGTPKGRRYSPHHMCPASCVMLGRTWQ